MEAALAVMRGAGARYEPTPSERPRASERARMADTYRVAEILLRDPVWSAYAICDLNEPLSSLCDWSVHGDALVLRFRGLAPPLLFPAGSGVNLECALDEAISADRQFWVNYTAEQKPAFVSRLRVTDSHVYLRMVLTDFVPATGGVREFLGMDRVGDLERLYADGAGPIFSPSQVTTGYFRGIEVDGRLIAAAGVHVLSREYQVATIGNVATDPDFRGRGYGRICTSAVVEALLADGYQTIVLNVEKENKAAVRIYEKLGFRTHCEFTDGRAERV